MLVLLPSPIHFSSPSVVDTKVSDTNYFFQTPERRRKIWRCHINMLKSYHFRKAGQEMQENTLETAAPDMTSASMVCVGTECNNNLTTPCDGQQCGRLSNSEILSNADAHVSYLP